MKRIISIILALVLIFSAAFAAAEGVQKAYYNSDYAYLGDEDAVYVSLTLEEAYYLFQQEGNYLILLGGSWCGNTTPVIGYINEIAKEYGVSTVYNLDFRLDGTNRSSHVRETEGAQSQGADIPGSAYNYLYGEIASRFLTNLNDYVEYKVDSTHMLRVNADTELIIPGMIAVDAAHFPDAEFRNLIADNFDNNDSGWLSLEGERVSVGPSDR